MQTQLVWALNYLAHGSKTRPIESFLFAGTLERRTRGRGLGGSDFQCPQRSGGSILSCSSKDLYMKKFYAWVCCADIVVPSCACRFCPPAYVSLPYLVCLVRYLRLFNHYLCSIVFNPSKISPSCFNTLGIIRGLLLYLYWKVPDKTEGAMYHACNLNPCEFGI